METIQQLEQQREAVLQQMRSIRSMNRGTINEQYFEVVRGGKKTDQMRGPYYVWSRKEAQRTISRRLRSMEQLQQARADIEAYEGFVELCRQFERLTERLGQLERQQGLDLQQEKKRRRLPSNRTKK